MKRTFKTKGPKPVAPSDLFWEHVEPALGDACWKWHGSTTQFGYGQFKSHQKRFAAHRFSYELHSGAAIPAGMHVCHSCDNPSCCNPRHLFLGTPKDNSADMLWRSFTTDAEAVFAAIEASGTHVVVPVEPTEAMKGIDVSDAFRTPCCLPQPGTFRCDAIYTAMLSARPKVTE